MTLSGLHCKDGRHHMIETPSDDSHSRVDWQSTERRGRRSSAEDDGPDEGGLDPRRDEAGELVIGRDDRGGLHE